MKKIYFGLILTAAAFITSSAQVVAGENARIIKQQTVASSLQTSTEIVQMPCVLDPDDCKQAASGGRFSIGHHNETTIKDVYPPVTSGIVQMPCVLDPDDCKQAVPGDRFSIDHPIKKNVDDM